MNNYINTRDLYGDEYKSVILSEFSYDLSLIKRLIDITDRCVCTKEVKDNFSFDGICHSFAKSIIEYGKAAYDNMIMGHFYTAYMINRVIIENNVCLDIISKNKDKQLWKYYIVYSYKETLKTSSKELEADEIAFISEISKNYNLDNDFMQSTNGKKAFIDRPYGWTYKINNNFNFEGLCNLVDNREYKDFRFMSKYSHGTSIYLKVSSSTSYDSIMNMLSCLYIGIYRLFMIYCPELQDEEFDYVTDEFESIIYNYIKSSKELFI